MPVLEQLTNLDRRFMRHHPADRFTAPPAWTPDDGPVRPLLLCQSQRIALWSLTLAVICGGAATLSLKSLRGVNSHQEIGSLLVVLLSPAGAIIGGSFGQRRQQRFDRLRPPALRWLSSDAPIRQPVIFSGFLVAAAVVGLILVCVTVSSLSPSLVLTPLEYCLFIPLVELPTRRRWRRVEQINDGQVVRLVRRGGRPRGTSGLYFRANGRAPELAPTVSRVSSDPGNAYRAPSH